MTTSGLISYIRRRTPDWDRQIILDVLNEIQNMVYAKPAEMMRVIDKLTGTNPILETEAGVLYYELDVPTFGHDVNLIDSVKGVSSFTASNGTFNLNDNTGVVTKKKTANTPANIQFRQDPGGNPFEVICYRSPQQLTSENIQLEIPEAYHMNVIAKGAIGKFEEAEHGLSKTWEEFFNYLLPEAIQAINIEESNRVYLIKGQGF